jgi:hypothetical protein
MEMFGPRLLACEQFQRLSSIDCCDCRGKLFGLQGESEWESQNRSPRLYLSLKAEKSAR